MISKIPEILKKVTFSPKKYWLILFYVFSITYLELLYRLWSLKTMTTDFIFPILFSLPVAFIFFAILQFFPIIIQRILATVFTLFLLVVYGVQLIYYQIFQMPLCLYSLVGTKDALGFGDVIFSNIRHNWLALILLFIPYGAILLANVKMQYIKINRLPLGIAMGCCLLSYIFALICVNLTGNSPVSQYTQYHNLSSLELSINKLGLMTAMRLDAKKLIFGEQEKKSNNETVKTMRFSSTYKVNLSSKMYHYNSTYVTKTPEISEEKPSEPMDFNVMDIDFENLISSEEDQILLDMDQYFSSVMPTQQNEYTGMFKGYNLIFITAEAFSSYAVNEELTPTLYKMANTGFVFNNFYNPIWGVSTSDGEYVACTGLIPKSGVWSFSESSSNALPFVMGNQFKAIGYQTRAYHDHSYSYYDRDKSHPNMGYDYEGVGNGLEIKESWPESDIEMIEVTAPEFISSEPFHTYFMTVSGHLRYTFGGNYIASKNKSLVENLPYSEGPRAYLACQLELDLAMKLLIDMLDNAGVLDKTVIVMSPDHYPYGLERENIDELASHEVESNFELYKSTLIIWKNGMEPITINKPCSSLDINPTISNLFGLEYDSRLLMGSDILSQSPPLVIFSNRSWMTDQAKYNSLTNTAAFNEGFKEDEDYVSIINEVVNDKFKYSAKILEEDYYRKLLK